MKTIRVYYQGMKAFGYKTSVATYGKTFGGKFIIELIIPWFEKEFRLYLGKKKPIFRNIYVLTVFWSLFIPIVFVGMFILSFLTAYFDGAKNFIRNSAWVDNVREFNLVNILLVIILSILLIIK